MSEGPQDAAQPARAPETAASVLPGAPRIAELDALLREVDSLRLTLETDLSLAASAVEAGAVEMGVEIVEADREVLHQFEGKALEHLEALATPVHTRQTHSRTHSRAVRWSTFSAAPLVAAAALVGLFVGVLPQHAQTSGGQGTLSTSLSADSSLSQLSQLTRDGGSTAQVAAAATQLNQQLAGIAKNAARNPAAARRAMAMLQTAQTLLLANADPDAAALLQALGRSQQLISQIQHALPKAVTSAAPLSPTVLVPTSTPAPEPSSKPKASPKPTASSSPSPKAKPSPSVKPSSSPSPTSSPSSSTPGLPGATGSGVNPL